MNIQRIEQFSIANGPGIRTVVWVSGCSHHCKECHNPQTWDENSGRLFTDDTVTEILDSLKPDYVQGITLSGGDPLYVQNQSIIYELIKEVIYVYGSTKDIWVYTGYTLDELRDKSLWSELNYTIIQRILSLIDVLVDGRFEIDKKDITLKYCGSTNQNVWNMKTGTIIK